MTSKSHPHRHPVVGSKHPDHPEHVHHHDRVMERQHSQRDTRNALAYLNSDDHPSCILPKDGSHTQGTQTHAAECGSEHGRTRKGETAKSRKAEGGRAGEGYG